MKTNSRILGLSGRPAEHDRGRAQRQAAIDPAKAFQDPAAEETRAARDEKTFSAGLLPEMACLFKNEIEVGGERILHRRLSGVTSPLVKKCTLSGNLF